MAISVWAYGYGGTAAAAAGLVFEGCPCLPSEHLQLIAAFA